MKYYSIYLYIFFIVLFNVIAFQRQENLFYRNQRLTHAVINGEVRCNDSLLRIDKNSHLIVELRRSRNDRPQTIARTKIQLDNNNNILLIIIIIIPVFSRLRASYC